MYACQACCPHPSGSSGAELAARLSQNPTCDCQFPRLPGSPRSSEAELTAFQSRSCCCYMLLSLTDTQTLTDRWLWDWQIKTLCSGWAWPLCRTSRRRHSLPAAASQGYPLGCSLSGRRAATTSRSTWQACWRRRRDSPALCLPTRAELTSVSSCNGLDRLDMIIDAFIRSITDGMPP